MTPAGKISIDLKELALAFAEALGLIGGKIVDHEKRVCHMTHLFARHMGFDSQDLEDLFFAALLHDAGISSTKAYANLFQLDWDQAHEHCADGAELVSRFSLFARPASLIRHHHSKWKEYGVLHPDDKSARLANIIFLADRIDFMLDWEKDLLFSRERIQNQVKELSNTFFEPDLVSVFLEISKAESFWISLYPRYLQFQLKAQLNDGNDFFANLSELEEVAKIFARVVDRKSKYTIDHSEKVGEICQFLAEKIGFPLQKQKMLKVAGLFHDLGKLAVPDEILDKPDNLTGREFVTIKHHPYETAHILAGIHSLGEIRDWASYHHERVDGSGYPFRISGSGLKPEHIIVIVADVFSALIKDRPYRSRLSKGDVLDLLDHMSSNHDIFSPFVFQIRENYDQIIDLGP